MRDNVLGDLASRAATYAEFLRRARRDPEGALVLNGYHLTEGELRLVEALCRGTAGMNDEELARTLAGGLRGRSGSPPTRPVDPS